MEDGYNLYSQGSSGWTSMRNEEFQEDDIWGVFRESKYSNSIVGSSKDFSTSSTPRGLPTAAKMIPRMNNNPGTHEPKPQILQQQSAPVNIPDWSKIYGKKHSKKTSNNSSWLDDHDDDDEDGDEFRRESWESDEDEDEDANMMPPHEWIAKKLARTQISSFSVCEGAGRTLKGRDLKRVRNAILRKTGFLED